MVTILDLTDTPNETIAQPNQNSWDKISVIFVLEAYNCGPLVIRSIVWARTVRWNKRTFLAFALIASSVDCRESRIKLTLRRLQMESAPLEPSVQHRDKTVRFQSKNHYNTYLSENMLCTHIIYEINKLFWNRIVLPGQISNGELMNW